MVWLIQQWLAVNGKSKNPAIAQSTCLYVSAGLQYIWDPQEVDSIACEEMDVLAK